MLINALVCDDEQSYIDEIAYYFREYCSDRSITYKIDAFNNGNDAINSPYSYNIAFLDIEIGKVSGINIAKSLQDKNKNIIIFFITAYEKYLDDAMDLFAIRYIKKPIDTMRFFSGLDRAVELINEDEISFYFKDSDKLINVKANEIMYIEIGNHKTIVATESGTYNSSDHIDMWERELTNICFSRPHKSFILNMEYIQKYKRNEVSLKNGKIIPIAYRRQTAFRKIFSDYLKRRK